MKAKKNALVELRKICLALPDTKETLTWGRPHFRVGEKIFAGFGVEDGEPLIGFKLELAHAAAVVEDPRFLRAPYVGHKGWVMARADRVRSWPLLQEMILESYRLIAPKKSLAKLEPAREKRASAKPRAKAPVERSKDSPRTRPGTSSPRNRS